MSNPGVISLASNPKFKLKIEDNIGEAIHLHYENIRLDLTVEEFEKLAGCMNDVIDELVSVEGFSSYNINPKNLTEISPFLYKLLKTKKDEIFLKDLFVNTNCGKYIPLTKIKNKINTDAAAIPQDEQIILFGDKNFIICGQEKCKNLYKLQGNIKVPVTRLFFDKTVTIKDIRKEQSSISLKKELKKLYRIVLYIIAKCKDKMETIF